MDNIEIALLVISKMKQYKRKQYVVDDLMLKGLMLVIDKVKEERLCHT